VLPGQLSDLVARTIMLKIAGKYEALAERAELRLATRASPRWSRVAGVDPAPLGCSTRNDCVIGSLICMRRVGDERPGSILANQRARTSIQEGLMRAFPPVHEPLPLKLRDLLERLGETLDVPKRQT
jgi:hypothetical protein